MTEKRRDYGTIHLRSPEAISLGLTSDRFGPTTSFWWAGKWLCLTNLDIIAPDPRKILHDLVARANDQGYIVVIPYDKTEPVDQELLEWGFVLHPCSLGPGGVAYLRGPPGVSLVDINVEKFGVHVSISDKGNEPGLTVQMWSRNGVTTTLIVDPGGITRVGFLRPGDKEGAP